MNLDETLGRIKNLITYHKGGSNSNLPNSIKEDSISNKKFNNDYLVKEILLKMNYDSKKTLSENKKIILKEGDETWKTTYSCVPKFPGAEKITLNDGSTGYKIESGTYYNNGRVDIGVRQNYSCNDMMFKNPKNQKEGDDFRNWLFKFYDANDLKREFDLDRSGPYNSKALAGAWIVYGEKYSDKKGRENPKTYINADFDPKCNNVPNMEYSETYKRCFLSKQRQKSLGDSVNFKDESFFPVKNDNEWYAYYALYMAQGVETQVAAKWTYNTSTGACKGSSDGSKGLNFPNKGTRNDLNAANLWKAISFNETPNQYGLPRNIEEMYTICFNESIVFGKPLGDIDVNNLTATAGRMDKSSFNRYNGYIPSYDEVIKAYGLHDVSAYTNKIWKTEHGTFVSSKSNTGDVKNEKPSVGVNKDDIHNIMMALEIGTAFIPVVGPLLSIGFGLIDAAIYAVDEPEMGAFLLVLTVLPELKIASNLFKSAKYASAYKSLLKKSETGTIESITKEELEFVQQLKKLDPKSLNSEVNTELTKKADEVLVKNTKDSKLSTEEYEALKKFTSGAKTSKIGFVSLDVFLGLAGGLTTKYGRDMMTGLFRLFEKNPEAIKSLVNVETGEIDEPKLAEILTDIDNFVESTADEKNEKKQMGNLIAAFESKPEEFVAYVQKEEVREQLQQSAKDYVEEKGLEVAEIEDIDAILASIPE